MAQIKAGTKLLSVPILSILILLDPWPILKLKGVAFDCNTEPKKPSNNAIGGRILCCNISSLYVSVSHALLFESLLLFEKRADYKITSSSSLCKLQTSVFVCVYAHYFCKLWNKMHGNKITSYIKVSWGGWWSQLDSQLVLDFQDGLGRVP